VLETGRFGIADVCMYVCNRTKWVFVQSVKYSGLLRSLFLDQKLLD